MPDTPDRLRLAIMELERQIDLAALDCQLLERGPLLNPREYGTLLALAYMDHTIVRAGA